MLQLSSYLENVKEEVRESRKNRESKVELDIWHLVNSLIKENKATTIKTIANTLNKSTQQIHQTIKKSTLVKKVKLEKRTLVVPIDMK